MSVAGMDVLKKLAEKREAKAEKLEKKAELAKTDSPKTLEERLKAVGCVSGALDKQFDTTGSLMRLGDRVGLPVPSKSTGMPSVDWGVIGTGGIPDGRIIEIFGPESAGKTTVALHIIAQEQKRGGLVALVDSEYALDPTWASLLGVNVDDLLVSQPDSAEQALETIDALVDSRAVTLIVQDSVSGLCPQVELDGEMGEAHVGIVARLMSQACRKLRGKCAASGIPVIFINQIREKIGVMFGSPETTSGGRALRFWASVRLDVRRREAIKKGDVQIGHQLEIKAIKNKLGAPFRSTRVNLMYDHGIDLFRDTVEYATKKGIIEQAGSWYSFGGEKLGQGMDNVVEALKEKASVMEQILAQLTEKH